MSNATKIQQGMQRQLQQWRTTLAAGDKRLGWKIGFNRVVDQQKFELPSAMVGYLTRQQQISSGQSYTIPAGSTILVEAEIALLIAADLPANATLTQARNVIQGYAAALELVDTNRTASNDITEMLAGNLFHAAAVIGSTTVANPGHFSVSLMINGVEVRSLEEERLAADFGAIAQLVANILGQQGESLQAGDWIICGALTAPVEVHGGDIITLLLEPLEEITLTMLGGN